MPATTKEVRFWIDAALECVRRDHTPAFGRGDQRGPFLTARALGMALGALHDGHVPPADRLLLPTLGLPAGVVGDAVVAAAACHQLLLHRYPSQAGLLNEQWDFWSSLFGVAPLAPAPEAYGRSLGDAIHGLGISDRHWDRLLSYSPSGAYTHAAPPHETQGFAGSSWGHATRLVTAVRPPFAKPPGRINQVTVVPDAHFAADFLEVQKKGASDPRARTPAEEVIGIFWGYDGPPELGTPPRLYLQLVLGVLDELDARNPAGLSALEELKVTAAAALAMADAGIDAWYYKYSADHMMWRPVLGVPHGLGALVPKEPGWLPLGRPDTNGNDLSLTPNFPAYPSGHATFGAAAFQLLRLYLVEKGLAAFDPNGLDNVRFCAASDEYNGRNRDPRAPQSPRPVVHLAYDSLWRAITDNSVSRVYLGVHWQFDGVTKTGADPDGEFGVPAAPAELGKRGGVWLGCQLANQVAVKIGVQAATILASRA